MAQNSPNQLYYGNNLDVLRLHVQDESVDLVYLDPPFNSNANYNVLFAERDGTQVGLIRFGGHLPKGEYDVDHDGHEGQAGAAELHG